MILPNKQLTAKVKLNIDDVERKVKQLNTIFKTINTAATQSISSNAMEKPIRKAKEALTEYDKAAQRLQANQIKNARREYENWWRQELDKREEMEKTATVANKISQKTNDWSGNLSTVKSMLKSNNSLLGSMWQKLKGIAATYLGVMGARAVITASDTITSAENRLNNLPGGNPQLTAESLDKIYGAAQRSRSGYSDMIGNVSKSMTLAGDAFQGNIDNAIRFQEIMSKAYTIGGASAAEQASSMYQLVQALGSGVLQGDELRSVREGAPIAYKKIEEFAQGVFDTEKSLKDLASQGVITSDIIVAAIMDAEGEITKSFENTKITFAQTWDNIKNMALKAFEPVLQKLNDLLNAEESQAAIQSIGNALVWLADKALILLDYLIQGVNWVADNWDWLKNVIIAAIVLMITWHMIKSAIVIACTLAEAAVWIAANWEMVLATLGIVLALGILVLGIFALLYVFFMWKTGAIDTCEAIANALIIVGIVFALIATLMTGGVYAIVGLAIAALGLILKYLGEFLGGVFVVGAAILNIFIGVINGIIQAVMFCIDPIIGVIEFILNACMGGFDSFGGACANLIGQIIGWFLQLGKVVTTIIDALIGSNWTGALEGLRSKVIAWGKTEKAITINRETPAINRISYGDAWNKGVSIGNNWKSSIGSLGSQSQNWDGLANIGNILNGTSSSGGGLPGAYDPALGVGGAYDPSGALGDINSGLDKLNGGVSDVGGSAGKIADSMEVTEEDLKYLRQIAEMEWKKEYTTASINIDMSNYNTVNGESDLDGIVTKLSDKLREELAVVANGVYA